MIRNNDGRTDLELRSCVNREVGLGSCSLSHSSPVVLSHTVSVDLKHHERRTNQESRKAEFLQHSEDSHLQ